MFIKKQINYDEYKKIQERAELIAIALGKQENKNFVKVRFPIQNYRKITIDDRDFYYGGTNIFLGILEGVLLDAQNKFPDKFGNNNAVTVLSALNKTRYLHYRLIDAIRIYKNENFIWIYDNINDGDENRIVRLDLFRILKAVPFEKKKWEFIGGLFHALKHFSFNGKNLSTGKDINNVDNIEDVVFMIIKAFYTTGGHFDETGEKYTILLKLNDKYNLKFVFFHEKNTKVYFINTIYKQRIKIKSTQTS